MISYNFVFLCRGVGVQIIFFTKLRDLLNLQVGSINVELVLHATAVGRESLCSELLFENAVNEILHPKSRTDLSIHWSCDDLLFFGWCWGISSRE